MAPLEAVTMRTGKKEQNLTWLMVGQEAGGIEKGSRYS